VSRCFCHRNNPHGTFDEVSKQAGLQTMPACSPRGAAFGDIFNTRQYRRRSANLDNPSVY